MTNGFQQGQFFHERQLVPDAEFDRHGAAGFKMLILDHQAKLLNQPHYFRGRRKFILHPEGSGHFTFNYLCLTQCVIGRGTVGSNQTAYPELGAAKIAHHHHKHVGELAASDLAQNGIAGGVIGFSVIKSPIAAGIGAQYPGIAMVAGIEVILFQLSDFFSDVNF